MWKDTCGSDGRIITGFSSGAPNVVRIIYIAETRENCNKDCTHKLSVCGNGVCENHDTDNYHSNW